MAEQTTSPTPILYQNASQNVSLLDIPRSIAHAQGTIDHPCSDQIYASPPLQEPYPSTEPKSEKAKINVLRTKRPSDANSASLEALLQQGLREVAEYLDTRGAWCLPRKVSPLVSERQGKKRKTDNDSGLSFSAKKADSTDPSTAVLPSSKLENLALSVEPDIKIPDAEISSRSIKEPLSLSSDLTSKTYTCSSVQAITNRLVRNPCPIPILLSCSGSNYRIPPDAKFILSKIGEPTAPNFSIAALTLYPCSSATAGPGQFDFVLLDPPWENRSVQRSAKYDTMHNSDPMYVLQAMLGQHIAAGALVACWITNKASVRDAALETFRSWDVHLIEEWAWLKTTTGGLPVTQIDGLWRKPYEVLLLGRKESHGVKIFQSDIPRRAVLAVPDLHSKKPQLKSLIEPFVPAHYRALEVFARNLTARWLSWGDEVLKYNWDGHWYTNEGRN